MNKFLTFLLGISAALYMAGDAQARGFGGCHPQGGSHGSFEGSRGRSEGEHEGSYSHNREPQHPPGAGESGGEHHGEHASDNYPHGEEAGAYHHHNDTENGHPNDQAYHPNDQAYQHPYEGGNRQYPSSLQGYHAAGSIHMPTDAGYGAAAGAGAAGYAAGHSTQATSAEAMAAHGAAVRNTNPAPGTFNRNWYGAHPDAWHPSAWATGDEWHAGSWGAVATAAGLSAAAQPVQYNYGNNVSYQGNQVYYGDQPAATSDQYYQQASTLSQSAPPSSPQTDPWTPLGVFALVQSQESAPHLIVQLAVSKSGAVAGNYADLITDTLQPVQGSVDRQTQRVAWTVGNNKNTVGEAGLYNLTQNEAPALIHIGSDKTQQWLLVRLKQPDSSGANP